ncbi:MAG TPA: hypothetical protein VLO09_04600 [Ornithinimicrobium sp.]|nr:hypothetical protein [Ornithinimicrobium sp.]
MATEPTTRPRRDTAQGTITTGGLVWGFLLGIPAGFVLQLVLGLTLGPLVEHWRLVAYLEYFSPLPAVAIAGVVALVPRLRRWGAGFVLGLSLGMAVEALLLLWWLSSLM